MKNNANMIFMILGFAFIAFGLGLPIVGINMMKSSSSFRSEAVSTEGVIVEIEVERYRSNGETRTRYILSVDYIIDGKNYENIVKSTSSSKRVGDKITLYYLPDAPWDIRIGKGIDTFWGGVLFIGVGGIFLTVGIVFLVKIKRKVALKNYLKENGKIIYAQVTTAETDFSVSVSGSHPYSFIRCMAMEPDSNEIKATYKSWSIKNDNLGSYVGKQVKVYLHPDDNKKYYVDLEDLTGQEN